MGVIKDRFKEKADIVAAEIKDIVKEHGDKDNGEVKLIADLPGHARHYGPGNRNFFAGCTGWHSFSRLFYS